MENGRLWVTIIVMRMKNSSVTTSPLHHIKAGLCNPSCRAWEDIYSIPFYAAVHSNHYSANITGSLCCSDNIEFQCWSSIVWLSLCTQIHLASVLQRYVLPNSDPSFVWQLINLQDNRSQAKFSHLYFSAVNQDKHASLGTVSLALYSATGSI